MLPLSQPVAQCWCPNQQEIGGHYCATVHATLLMLFVKMAKGNLPTIQFIMSVRLMPIIRIGLYVNPDPNQ